MVLPGKEEDQKGEPEMTTKTNATETAREFELDDITYERKESGYCFRDGTRIRSEVLAAAEREFDAREAAKAEPAEIPGVRKDLNPTATIDGHEYVHDWVGRAYYKDGAKVTRAQFEAETGGDPEAAKALTARKRRPKDVAGEFETSEGTVTLTAKQLDFLHEVSKLTSDDLLGSFITGCWCDVLCDAIGGQFAGKPMAVGAMISTICEKGLGERSKEDRSSVGARTRKVTAFRLTDKGIEVWKQVTA